MSSRHVIRPAALGLALTALGASTAAAQPQDLRSPDTRDAAAQSAARPDATTVPSQDLRSPDTRDAAAHRVTTAPRVVVVRMPPAQASSDGIDWGDAGLGAGGVLGLTVLAAGGAFAILHRRQGRTARPTPSAG